MAKYIILGKIYETMPIRYFIMDRGPGFQVVYVGPSPDVPYGTYETDLAGAQAFAQKYPQAQVSGLVITITREQLLKGEIPEDSKVFASIPELGFTYVKLETVEQAVGMLKKVDEGLYTNIGTPNAPLYVPIGSPAEQLVTASPEDRPIIQKLQIELGRMPTTTEIEAEKKEIITPTEEKIPVKKIPTIAILFIAGILALVLIFGK
jgi:hypothetical protein